MNLEKIFSFVIAAVAGWVFASLPKIAQRKMSWLTMGASIGLAAVVGFIGGSLLSWAVPHLPTDVVCSITSVLGAGSQHWMERFGRLANRAADRMEDAALNMIAPDEEDDEDGK